MVSRERQLYWHHFGDGDHINVTMFFQPLDNDGSLGHRVLTLTHCHIRNYAKASKDGECFIAGLHSFPDQIGEN